MDRNELVEKATLAMYEARPLDLDQEDDEWETLPDSWKEEWRDGARAAVDAILPDVIVEERLIDVGEYEFAVGIKHRGVRRFRKEQRMVTPWVAVLGDALKGGK